MSVMTTPPRPLISIGTKSVLFGAHCFLLHPWFVAFAWWRLFGFPWDPRLWVAFVVHDLWYVGKPNMDGPEGEFHPLLGARIMTRLFDRDRRAIHIGGGHGYAQLGVWGQFCLLHSRYFAKSRFGSGRSRLRLNSIRTTG